MKPKSLLWVAACLVTLLSSPSKAQEVEMQSLDTLESSDINLQVIGANPQDPAAWPATLIFKANGKGCTATVIGSRVVITAAHCVADGAVAQVKLRGQMVSIQCFRHPAYAQQPEADFALCVTDEGKVFPTLPFEVINRDRSKPAKTGEVFLLGYGCLTENGVDRTFGELHGNPSTVKSTPQNGGYYVTTLGGAAVCFGDSGGGSYVRPDANTRLLFGVNSAGNIKDRSRISTTSAPAFLSWAEDWAANLDVEICGLTDGAKGCRPI